MRFYTIDLNGQGVNLRLTSEDCLKIEKNYNVKLFDYIGEGSITSVVTLLRYMLQGGQGKTISQGEAQQFFDELVDNGWKVENIVMDIIMPTAEVSGLLTQSDLEMARDQRVMDRHHFPGGPDPHSQQRKQQPRPDPASLHAPSFPSQTTLPVSSTVSSRVFFCVVLCSRKVCCSHFSFFLDFFRFSLER